MLYPLSYEGREAQRSAGRFGTRRRSGFGRAWCAP